VELCAVQLNVDVFFSHVFHFEILIQYISNFVGMILHRILLQAYLKLISVYANTYKALFLLFQIISLITAVYCLR